MKKEQRKGPSLLDKDFRYFNSSDTCLRRTFARIRREQREVKLPGPRTVVALQLRDKKKA